MLSLIVAYYVVPQVAETLGAHHTHHVATFGEAAPGTNRAILAGIDRVQATAPDGGGYFIGVKAIPAESPIGYPLQLICKPLLAPPRSSSYCSGSSYAGLIEGLNELFRGDARSLTATQHEIMRMQEPDGARREDGVKFWGWWNADGYGNHFALTQYTNLGVRISPHAARPGDFLNISWKSGNGHSTIFLGWCKDAKGEPAVRYWASQKGTNGLGDQVSALSLIKEFCFVRLVHPERVYTFVPNEKVTMKVIGDLPNEAEVKAAVDAKSKLID